MSWFEKLMPSRISTEKRTRSVPQGVWMKCPECDEQLYRKEVERNLNVCPKCAHHMRIGARTRLEYFLDPDSQEELAANLEPQTRSSFAIANAIGIGSSRPRKRPARRTRWSPSRAR